MWIIIAVVIKYIANHLLQNAEFGRTGAKTGEGGG